MGGESSTSATSTNTAAAAAARPLRNLPQAQQLPGPARPQHRPLRQRGAARARPVQHGALREQQGADERREGQPLEQEAEGRRRRGRPCASCSSSSPRERRGSSCQRACRDEGREHPTCDAHRGRERGERKRRNRSSSSSRRRARSDDFYGSGGQVREPESPPLSEPGPFRVGHRPHAQHGRGEDRELEQGGGDQPEGVRGRSLLSQGEEAAERRLCHERLSSSSLLRIFR